MESTPFSGWLRAQKDLDSGLGYVTSNIDFLWRNYKTGHWMLVEEKRFMAECDRSQYETLCILDKACLHDKNYRGMHLIQFERTSPKDGKIYIDGKEVDESSLVRFLQVI